MGIDDRISLENFQSQHCQRLYLRPQDAFLRERVACDYFIPFSHRRMSYVNFNAICLAVKCFWMAKILASEHPGFDSQLCHWTGLFESQFSTLLISDQNTYSLGLIQGNAGHPMMLDRSHVGPTALPFLTHSQKVTGFISLSQIYILFIIPWTRLLKTHPGSFISASPPCLPGSHFGLSAILYRF